MTDRYGLTTTRRPAQGLGVWTPRAGLGHGPAAAGVPSRPAGG
jgi:hypothetical protein